MLSGEATAPVRRGRPIPIGEQLRRRDELDAIRCQRRLTEAEQEEADILADRAYMRVWRQQQVQIERSFEGAPS